jgi:cell division protein FtsL
MKISVERYRATDNIKKSLKKKLVSSKSVIPVLIVISCVVLACLHIWQRVYVMHLVTETTVLEMKNKRLKDLVKKANLEVLELSSLSRIEKIAAERLHMNGSRSENIFTLILKETDPRPEGLNDIISSLRKVADNFPVISESKAETVDIFELDEN